MKTQEMFDKIVAHLLTQNARAIGDLGCAYRDGTRPGISCAVGCLIPDHLYRKSFENKSVSTLVCHRPASYVFGFPLYKGQLQLLGDMQDIHDTEPPSHWHMKLHDYAANSRSLTFNSPFRGETDEV